MIKVIGGKIPQKEHRKLLVEDTVDYMLERLIFARDVAPFMIRKDCQFRPENMGPMWTPCIGGDSGLLFNGPDEVNSPELVWPVGVGFITRRRDDEWGDHLQCNYFQSTPAKLLRGKFKYVGKYNIAHYQGYLCANGEWFPSVYFASWHLGKWRDSGRIGYDDDFIKNVRPEGGCPVRIGVKREDGDASIGEICSLGQSAALTYRYEWGAQFSIDGSPRVIIPTTPRGILELFNDRNKPADKDRRAALRHWVKQHIRRGKHEGFHGVREHLRGELRFSWRGFDVEVKPSQFDLERAA